MQLRNPAVFVNAQITGIGMMQSVAMGEVEIATLEQSAPPSLWLGRYSRIPKLKATYRPRRGEKLVPSLLALARRFEGKGVLFLSHDQDLEEVLDAYDELSERYWVPASKEVGHRILDKDWQYEMAERSGHPLPPFVRFKGGEQPSLDHLGLPLIIKPASRAAAEGAHVFRLRIVRDREELARCLEGLATTHTGRAFQAAEIIPGGPDHLYTVGSYSNRQGRVLSSYTGRKLSQFPWDHGSVSVAETLTLPPHVIDNAQALLNQGKIHGITQVELKLDPRDGQFKLIEINDRGWLWVKLAAFSGVNLPLMQYYDLTGDPRLADLLTRPQRDDFFYVYDFHVKMNASPEEQAMIRELRGHKHMVPAVYAPGEWLLNTAYWLNISLRRAKRAVVGQPPREQQFVTQEG